MANEKKGKAADDAPMPALTGDALEDARMDALTADQRAGAHAAVIREVARLQQDNRHLKRQNLRIWSISGLLTVALIVGMGAAFWWFPKYRYIATTDNRAVCEVATRSEATVTPASLQDFAKEAAINSYSYDYVNYRDLIGEATNRWYNERGRKAFLKSLDESGNLERVVKGRLIMKSFATNAPQLESEGRQGTQRFWIVNVPIAIEFYVGGSGSPNNIQDFVAEVKVMQEQASAANLKGIAVDSIILKPTARRK